MPLTMVKIIQELVAQSLGVRLDCPPKALTLLKNLEKENGLHVKVRKLLGRRILHDFIDSQAL